MNDLPYEIMKIIFSYLNEEDLHVSYSDVNQNDTTNAWEGTGNMYLNPLFDQILGEYHITYDSPCRDAGDPNPYGYWGDYDIYGKGRIYDPPGPSTGRVDIGCDEIHQQ